MPDSPPSVPPEGEVEAVARWLWDYDTSGNDGEFADGQEDEYRDTARDLIAALGASRSGASGPTPNNSKEVQTLGDGASGVEGDEHDWRQEAWECYCESGADPDGADARHLNPGEAVAAVRELRQDYRDALDEIPDGPAAAGLTPREAEIAAGAMQAHYADSLDGSPIGQSIMAKLRSLASGEQP
jgi:hypothetical protein